MTSSLKVLIGRGEPCPKCNTTMTRFKHRLGWRPKPNQGYYFKFWDVCDVCNHIAHYDAAKVKIRDQHA